MEKRDFLKTLILIDITLLMLYLFTNHFFRVPSKEIRLLFDMDAEANLPTWFSSIKLFALAALAFFYARRLSNRRLRRAYILIGLVFLFFSADEAARIHETSTVLLQKIAIYSPLPDAHGIWILIYPALLLIMTLLFRQEIVAFLKEAPGRFVFIAGAALFVTGGVAFEVLGYTLDRDVLSQAWLYRIEVSFEETFELLGQSLMVYALLCKSEACSWDVFGFLRRTPGKNKPSTITGELGPLVKT